MRLRERPRRPAADTSLGPLYLAYGLADRGFHTFYPALGVPLS